MSRTDNGNGGACDLTVLIRLFGPPPLLSHEKLEHFEEMANRFIACMRPEDFVISALVYQVCIETWLGMRWTRFQALMINRWETTKRKLDAKRRNVSERRKAEQKDPPELFKEATIEIVRATEFLPSLDKVYEDCLTSLAIAEEMDLVAAFEHGIDTLQKVEPFISEAQKRRNDAFRQIEWCRVGLAQDLRKEVDAVIEGECVEIEAAIGTVPSISSDEDSP